MIVVALATLVLLGSATWSAQSYPFARDRRRCGRVTGILLGVSAVVLLADALYAVVFLS